MKFINDDADDEHDEGCNLPYVVAHCNKFCHKKHTRRAEATCFQRKICKLNELTFNSLIAFMQNTAIFLVLSLFSLLLHHLFSLDNQSNFIFVKDFTEL